MTDPRSRRLQSPKKGSKVRIIGGRWRGRNLSFYAADGLRPTPGRVRETVFNWLANRLPGAACLDLFAGTGALGFEAVSRGAGSVTIVDNSAVAIGHIKKNIISLATDQAVPVQADVKLWLKNPQQTYRIVFIDPPYAANMLSLCCKLLEEHDWLEDLAWIYLEHNRAITEDMLPQTWSILKHKKAGQVYYCLAERDLQSE